MANTSANPSESQGLSGDSRRMLEKHLAQFKSSESIMSVADRLFQKVPGLASDMQQQVEWQCQAAGTNNKTQRAWAAKKALVDTVAKAIRHGWMPHKLENYVSFLDLAGVVASSQSDPNSQSVFSSRTWSTFLLQDFDAESLSQLPLHRLRRRLKQFLPETNLSSVQIDLEEQGNNQSAVSRVFFRVATVARSKGKKPKHIQDRTDEDRLLKKDATFIVFYPNEPYFYCDKRHPDPVILEVLETSIHYIRNTVTATDFIFYCRPCFRA